MADQTVSIIGCGWLGLPLAERLIASGYSVRGSTTTDEKLPTLRQRGIVAYQLRLGPEPVGDLPGLLRADTLIINVPPKAGKVGNAFHPRQVEYLVEAVRQTAVYHIVYVSSTSVYPEENRLVHEEEVSRPEESAAPGLLQAEQLVQTLGPERIVTVVRFGGLMGYDRLPGKYVAGRIVNSGAAPVNYVHRDDAVGILFTLIRRSVPGTFNAVAPAHPTRMEVYQKSCADFGYSLPSFVEPDEPVPFKVISPEKLTQATNYVFRYPDPLQFFYAL